MSPAAIAGLENDLGWFGTLIADLRESVWIGLALAAAAGLAGLLGGRGLRRARRDGGPEARKQWARRLADASFDGLLIHRNGTILQMNRALVRMLGYREMELLGTHFANLAHPAQVTELRTELEAPQPQIAEFTLLHADKSERHVEMASHTLEFDGMPVTVTAIRNLTALKAIEARLAHLMNNDALTGLPNRDRFAEKLQEAVSRNDASGGSTALVVLEVAELKAINEQLGRGGGDALLRQIANRLLALAHESDTVARLGGDKFGIVQPHGGAPNRTASLTSQIETAMQQPFIVEGKAVTAHLAIGVALYPEHAADAEGLMKAGTFALNKAVETGSIHSFSHAEAAAAGFGAAAALKKAGPGPRALTLEQQRLAQDLRTGLPRGEVSLEYQPVFGTKFLSIAGFEALARWRHPKEGLIPPDRFIPLADDAGLAGALGGFIIETACLEAMRCKAPMMAVNFSPMQFRDPHLIGRMREILQKTGLPPSRLEVQVTETLLAADPEAASAALRDMAGLGVTITLDDFGAGFSSLSHLADFPFNRIKIDKRFIHLLEHDANAQAIVIAILSLAKGLQIEVTAEGVESEAQLNFLQEKGCSFVQGYHLGRPAPQASTLSVVTPTAAKPSLVATQR